VRLAVLSTNRVSQVHADPPLHERVSQTQAPSRKEVGRHYTRFQKRTRVLSKTYSRVILQTPFISSEAAELGLAPILFK
jgi:hypothetical protein